MPVTTRKATTTTTTKAILHSYHSVLLSVTLYVSVLYESPSRSVTIRQYVTMILFLSSLLSFVGRSLGRSVARWLAHSLTHSPPPCVQNWMVFIRLLSHLKNVSPLDCSNNGVLDKLLHDYMSQYWRTRRQPLSIHSRLIYHPIELSKCIRRPSACERNFTREQRTHNSGARTILCSS